MIEVPGEAGKSDCCGERDILGGFPRYTKGIGQLVYVVKAVWEAIPSMMIKEPRTQREVQVFSKVFVAGFGKVLTLVP